MIYNTILVQLDIYDSPEPRLKFAGDLASRFEANVIGYAAADPRSAGIPSSGVSFDAETYRRETESLERQLSELKLSFEQTFQSEENRSWRPHLGDPTRGLIRATRAADLIVTGSPARKTAADAPRSIDLGELILNAGRPVLLAGVDAVPLKAERILVAWKDCREARRAVVDAMPFLVHAQDVLVVTLEGRLPSDARESATDVVRFLDRHGARARAEIVVPDEPEDSAALIAEAKKVGADLIVAGAYGHSRLREWAFGGMTRSLLGDDTINRLLSN